jgi:ribonucleoside-diphosphate reductase alpha chain
MAEELGPFPIWNPELEKDCIFFQRFENDTIYFKHQDVTLSGKDLIDRMKKVGRRNISLLTTAPAGTVSLLTQTTSGIEPLYQISYFRKKKGNHNDEHFRADFVDQNGDTWMEFKVYHTQFYLWSAVTGKTDEKESPWFNSCANDIDWKQRVKLQGAVQKHVDHAISSTINLPSDVSIETVAEIYETAWRAGCKGMTVYRDGCRTGVLTSESSKVETAGDKDRPKSLNCEIHHATVKGKQYFILVGIHDEEPYEVFAGKNGILDKSIKFGKIVKKKKGFYQLVSRDGKELYLAPITLASNEEEETVTRLTSLALQGGVGVHRVVKQLEKVDGEMHGFARAIARILKKYIADGTEEKGEICPTCNGSNIVRQEGCVTCKDCGWSKCL